MSAALVVTALLFASGASSLVLTPDAAVARALERSPQLRTLRARRVLEQVRADSALTLSNPTLRLRSQVDVDAPIERALDQTTTVGVRWSPPSSRALFGRRVAARRAVARRDVQLAAAASSLRAKVRAAYAALLYEQDRLAAADIALALSARQRDAVSARLEAGAATQLQWSLLELEHVDAQGERQEIAAAVAERERALRDLLGVAAQTAVKFERGRELCQPLELSDDELVQRALDAAPSLAVIEARLFELKGNEVGRWLRFAPWPKFIEAAYEAPKRSDRLENNPESPLGGVRLRLGVTLPVFNQGQARGRILGARRALLLAERSVERERVQRRARELAADLRDHLALLARLERSTAPLVQSSMALLSDSLEAGSADLVDVNDVRRRVLRAKRTLLRTRFQCEKTAIALDALLGNAGEVE